MQRQQHVAWTCLLALWGSSWFADPVDAQTLRLRQAGSNASRIAVQVGQVINIEVYADLQGVSSAGVEFFLSVPDAFQVEDQGGPGQPGVQPFVLPRGSLFSGAVTPSNLLLLENDPVAATLPGQQLDFSAVLGLGSDRNRTGSGVVATFRMVAVRPIENGVLRIDDNAVRETKLVLSDGIDDRRFVTTQGMEITVNGMELLDIPDVILQPGQSDSVQIGRLDNWITNTLSPADSIRWTFESDDALDSVDVSIDPVTRLVRVIPVEGWRGSVRIVWTATDPRRPSPGQPLLSATEVSTIVVNNRPLFDIEPDPDGIKRIRIRLVEDNNTFDPGIPTPDARRAARFMDLDDLVIDPDVTNPDLELNYAALPLPQGRPVSEVNVRGSDDESNHTLLAWSRPDFGGSDSLGILVSGMDTSVVYGGIDSFRVIVRDPFQGRDTLRVIAEVVEVPDAPRIVETETQPRVSRGSTKRYLFPDFVQDPDTPLDALVVSWINDPSGNFFMDTTRAPTGELVLEVQSSPTFVGTGPIVVTVTDPVDPMLTTTETFFFTASESLPPDVFPDNIKVPVEPGETWNVSLDALVSDPDNPDAELSWSVPTTANAQIGIDAERNVTVAAPLDFHGYELVQLIVTDPDDQKATLLLRIYSSDGRPVTGGIPDIVLDRGDQNREYDLDDYYHDSNNTDSQMDWDVLPTFDEESLSVSVDALTHIVTFAASPNASFGTETVILRVTDSQGVSHQDTVLVTIQSGGLGPVTFQLQSLPPLQARVGEVVEVIANLHDYVVTSPEVSRSSIEWALESAGDVGFARTRRQTDESRPDGFRWPLTALADRSGVDTLRLVATDSLGRSHVATTTIRYFGDSEILELRSLPDIVFIAGDIFEGLTLNDYIVDPVAHPDSVISWSLQDIGQTDSDIIPRIRDDSSVTVVGFEVAETQVIFIARNNSLGVTGRDTVRVIAQDPSLAARELDPLPPLVIQTGSVDSTIVLNDFLPADLREAQTNWSVSGATITNPVIDPTTPHRLRVSSIGTSVGSDTLSFSVRLGGGFRATGTMVVTVIETVDESTLSLRVVPNPINANFLDFFVMARAELASSPTVTLSFEGDTTIAVRQIEEDLAARSVLIWAGSYHVRFGGSGTVRFGASAITTLGTSVNAQTTVALGTATAGKALVLRHQRVQVTAPPDALRDGQRIYLQSAASVQPPGAGRRVVANGSAELQLVQEVSLWPSNLELREPATLQHPDLELPGAALYRANAGGWEWLGADRTGSVDVSRFGRLAVPLDARAPQVHVEDHGDGSLAILATDAGSGLDETSVAVLIAGVRRSAKRDADGWTVQLGAPPESAGSQDVVVVARDRVGNEGRHRLRIDVPALPVEARLGANYPNPFNPETVIPVQLPASVDGVISLRIYNAAGQIVRELLNGSVEPGWLEVTWDGRDGAGRPVGSGVYFYRLEGPGVLHTRSMTLLK